MLNLYSPHWNSCFDIRCCIISVEAICCEMSALYVRTIDTISQRKTQRYEVVMLVSIETNKRLFEITVTSAYKMFPLHDLKTC